MPFLATLVMQMGETDCEEIQSGLLKQPVNAWSSLSFSVVGLLIALSATRASGPEQAIRLVFGILMVATGIGSFLFHGPQSPGSQFAHDVTFLATVWFLAVMNLVDSLSWRPQAGWIAFGVGTGIIAVLLVAFPDITNILTGIVLGVLVLAGLAVLRTGGVNGGWYAVALGALAIAVGLLIIGRSASPLCDPLSTIQPHGGWHGFIAVALGAYFLATSQLRTARRRSVTQP